MTNKEAKRLLKMVAKNNHTDLAHVRKEIENAILLGMSNPDPSVQEKWRKLCPDGHVPSAEEIICLLACDIHENH